MIIHKYVRRLSCHADARVRYEAVYPLWVDRSFLGTGSILLTVSASIYLWVSQSLTRCESDVEALHSRMPKFCLTSKQVVRGLGMLIESKQFIFLFVKAFLPTCPVGSSRISSLTLPTIITISSFQQGNRRLI